VKTRGTFGEVQLAGLLEQVFTPEQYATNVETVPGSGARVEFAIRCRASATTACRCGCRSTPSSRARTTSACSTRRSAPTPEAEARRQGDRERCALEAKDDPREVRGAAAHHRLRILFVPTEGLYAEALRRPGLVEALQREHRVMLAGPTTLLATLTSLQMGFRTLALEKRSAEVWEVLGAVKTEFGKFGDVLAKTKKKLDEASNTICNAEVRTRVMTRELQVGRGAARCRAPAAAAGLPRPTMPTCWNGRRLSHPTKFRAPLLALIVGQICLHSCMAGVRMAAPLMALREGHSAWTVGCADGAVRGAPVVLRCTPGRLADRHGYHLPVHLAVG
jgi:DNA recombination protein RmuC